MGRKGSNSWSEGHSWRGLRVPEQAEMGGDAYRWGRRGGSNLQDLRVQPAGAVQRRGTGEDMKEPQQALPVLSEGAPTRPAGLPPVWRG